MSVYVKTVAAALVAALFLITFPHKTITSAQSKYSKERSISPPEPSAASGTTNLFTITGGGAGTNLGDYVSAGTGGLDTFYSFFVEVPPAISELNLEIFDADVGLGGAAEAGAGRDRARTGFDSSVTYSVIDPSGATRPISFTTGDAAGPAGSDNAWLALLRGTGRTVRDNFAAAAYSNNNGTDNFSANWIEVDAGGAGAAAGTIQITGGQLRLQDGVAGTPSLEREADLLGTPGLNFTRAFLNFDYNTSNNLEGTDQIVIEVSNNGGGTWTTLETFSDDSSGSRQYDITGQIANNTRVRFRLAGGYTGTEFFFVDNLEINDGGPLTPGHWEVRIDMSTPGNGDDINALGIRAHDGNSGAGGTELPVYAAGMIPLGVNNPAAGSNTRSYTLYPYITSGCNCSKNDFDYDSNSGTVGSMNYSSRTAAFSQAFASGTLSTDDSWSRGNITGWTSDTNSSDYGIWTAGISITSYIIAATQNSNYTDVYIGNSAAAANPPTANPMPNSFRIYLPTDAGGAPAKPYVSQNYVQVAGSNPLGVGATGTMRVFVQFANPTTRPVVFSAANLITVNVPGAGATYSGPINVSQGSLVSQPAIGGTGNITWNPGTVAAGGTVHFIYDVAVTPTSAGQRVPVTGNVPSGNGTRAQYVDETGNTTQARATYLFGPICELAVTQGVPNPAPSAAPASVGGRVITPSGLGLVNAFVTLTSFDGETRTVRTGTSGKFAFSDVESGKSYTLSVSSRRYVFQPIVLNVSESVSDLEFRPME